MALILKERMEPFKTKKEVDEYLDGTRIECLICGRLLKSLATHLVRVHTISVDEYKRQYGIPWCRGLICSASSEKCKESVRKRIKSGNLNHAEMSKRRKGFKKKQREQIGYCRDLCVEKAKKGREVLALRKRNCCDV